MILLTDKFLYVALIITNIFSNICYKKLSVSFMDLLFYRYVFLFIFSFLLIIFNFNAIIKPSGLLYGRRLLLFNIARVISSFIAILCDLKQINSGRGFLDTTLIYYSIPLLDLLLYRFYNKTPNQQLFLMFSANLFILIYHLYYFSFNQYIYGYIASIFFSISNMLFLTSKHIWSYKPNKVVILLDMMIFSLLAMLLTVGVFGYSEINSLTWSTCILSFSGAIVTMIIYFFFFLSKYNPSFILSNLDLSLSLLVDIILFSIYPNVITTLTLVFMLYTIYKQQK